MFLQESEHIWHYDVVLFSADEWGHPVEIGVVESVACALDRIQDRGRILLDSLFGIFDVNYEIVGSVLGRLEIILQPDISV